MNALLNDPDNIKLGIIGMSEGNGHPFSWSAMINGYNKEAMTAKCPFAGIPVYLNKEPESSFDIHSANVTHIYCDDKKDAELVAECAYIPNIVDRPEDFIGEVDGVIIATDQPQEHVERARPFIEAGLPLLVDKPLCGNLKDLKIFKDWVVKDGHHLLSSSSLRFRKEFIPYRLSTNELGALRFLSMTMPKQWKTYGIHALEAMYTIVGSGFESVQNLGDGNRDVVHLKHKKGIDMIITCMKDMPYGGPLRIAGTHGQVCVSGDDFFYSFKALLVDFVNYLRSGERSYPFSETEELMKIITAGLMSRAEGNRKIYLKEFDL